MHAWNRCLVGALLATVFAGCGDPAAKLIGTWDAQISPAKAAESSSLEDSLANAFAFLPQMTLEFKADGKLTLRFTVLGQAVEQQATWKYLKSEGNVLVLEVQPENRPSTTTRLTMISDDEFELVPPESGESLPLGTAAEALRFKRSAKTQ